MSTASPRVTVTLPPDLLKTVDANAQTETRSRSQQIAHLLRIGLAGRQRLRELEDLAQQGLALAAGGDGGTAAATEHLRAHARLSGITGETE